MLQLHETLTKKKTAMTILELAKIQDGYCYTTDLETSLKSNSCNNYQNGLYYIINSEPVPADQKLDEFRETDFNKSKPLLILMVFLILINQGGLTPAPIFLTRLFSQIHNNSATAPVYPLLFFEMGLCFFELITQY